MDMITQSIFVGNNQEARKLANLKANSITAVLNVARDLDIVEWFVDGESRTRFNGIEYQKAGLIDGPGNTQLELIAPVILLQSLLSRHNNVLVICHEGKSRSVTVVALHLAHIFGGMLTDHFNTVIKKREGVKVHEELRKCAFELYGNRRCDDLWNTIMTS